MVTTIAQRIPLVTFLCCCCLCFGWCDAAKSTPVAAFAAAAVKQRVSSQQQSRFMGQGFRLVQRSNCNKKQRSTGTPTRTTSSSSLNMFLGSDGGILGVGTPEVFTILLVGYFVLGPNELYKLVKEVGVFVQNFRTLGAQATETFQSTMESSLELQEIRKAQRELNDAFNFRRTINVEEESDAFATNADSERKGELAGQGADTTSTTAGGGVKGENSSSSKRKRKKKKKKKKVVKPDPLAEEKEEEGAVGGQEDYSLPNLNEEMGLYPDLEMPSEAEPVDSLRQERLERLASGTQPSSPPSPDWYSDGAEAQPPTVVEPAPDPAVAQMEQDRFAAQMSGNWNQQILDNEDALDPMARIMQKIALLEEEKQAADLRLEEEFAMRAELEEKYYRKKKELLEEAVAEVQTNAFAAPTNSTTTTSESVSTTTTSEASS